MGLFKFVVALAILLTLSPLPSASASGKLIRPPIKRDPCRINPDSEACQKKQAKDEEKNQSQNEEPKSEGQS